MPKESSLTPTADCKTRTAGKVQSLSAERTRSILEGD